MGFAWNGVIRGRGVFFRRCVGGEQNRWLKNEMRLRFQYRRYRLPLRVAVRTAHGVMTEREGVLVRLDLVDKGGSSQGISGLGEAAPVPGFGLESVDEIEAACRSIGEWVESEKLLETAGLDGGRLGCLRGAIGAAWADVQRQVAAGSEAGEGARSAGAKEGPPAPYLGVAALVPAGRAALREVAVKADGGFRVFKWKVGVGDIADELALLDDVCAALPDGARLRLDANGAWDRRKAERWLERCADRPVEFVEQPIASDARGAEDLLLGLAEDFPTPLALDESLVGERDVERWAGAGWRGVFVVKPSLLGDVAGAMDLLARAKADVVFSSALETAVGARSALRVAFAWAGRGASLPAQPKPRALGFGVWPLYADARFDGPYAAPFLRAEDMERIDVEAVWNALS